MKNSFNWGYLLRLLTFNNIHCIIVVRIFGRGAIDQRGSSWLWSYGSWIYNYLYNQCLSSLKLWVRTLLMRGVLYTTLCDKVCQWLAAGQWFSLGTRLSSTNKTDCQDISEILLKVALNTITLTLTHWPDIFLMICNTNLIFCTELNIVMYKFPSVLWIFNTIFINNKLISWWSML